MACDPHSGWVTAVQVSAAALTPVIAIVGGWIAWQQVRINRNKLKLDRFDKRFDIHEAAIMFAAAIAIRNMVDEPQFQDFIKRTRGTRFLISKEMQDYVDLLRTNALRVQVISQTLARTGVSDEERVKHGDEMVDLIIWFKDQIEVIPEKFAPFLSVEDI